MFSKVARMFRNRRPSLMDSGSIAAKASRFVACEMVEGDYLEFGVFQGSSFSMSYRWLERNFRSRIKLNVGGEGRREGESQRRAIWDNMRFFAFDSFEGLPKLSEEDSKSHDFFAGQYACDKDTFLKNISRSGIPLHKTFAVKGFFSDTCNAETIKKYRLEKAAIVWLDADLYSSTITVLNFITPLVQDGTVLVFDDWFSFRGSPFKGVQKAFNEWAESVSDDFVLVEYQRDSWKRNSFIVCEK